MPDILKFAELPEELVVDLNELKPEDLVAPKVEQIKGDMPVGPLDNYAMRCHVLIDRMEEEIKGINRMIKAEAGPFEKHVQERIGQGDFGVLIPMFDRNDKKRGASDIPPGLQDAMTKMGELTDVAEQLQDNIELLQGHLLRAILIQCGGMVGTVAIDKDWTIFQPFSKGGGRNIQTLYSL